MDFCACGCSDPLCLYATRTPELDIRIAGVITSPVVLSARVTAFCSTAPEEGARIWRCCMAWPQCSAPLALNNEVETL